MEKCLTCYRKIWWRFNIEFPLHIKKHVIRTAFMCSPPPFQYNRTLLVRLRLNLVMWRKSERYVLMVHYCVLQTIAYNKRRPDCLLQKLAYNDKTLHDDSYNCVFRLNLVDGSICKGVVIFVPGGEGAGKDFHFFQFIVIPPKFPRKFF